MSGIFSPHGDSFMLTAAAVIYGRSLGNLISRPVCSIHTQTQAEDHMLNSSISTLLFTLRGQINDTATTIHLYYYFSFRSAIN